MFSEADAGPVEVGEAPAHEERPDDPGQDLRLRGEEADPEGRRKEEGNAEGGHDGEGHQEGLAGVQVRKP